MLVRAGTRELWQAATFMNTPSDIKTPEDVKTLVDAFYEKVNRDELLGSCL